MNLTAEQIELLKNKLEELENRRTALQIYAETNLAERLEVDKAIQKITKEIMLAATLSTNNSDVIGLGSKFSATVNFFGKLEVEDYLISDSDLKVPGYMIITTTTPIAQAVMGLKENDVFSYYVNGNIFNGIVNKIYKEVIEPSKEKTIK